MVHTTLAFIGQVALCPHALVHLLTTMRFETSLNCRECQGTLDSATGTTSHHYNGKEERCLMGSPGSLGGTDTRLRMKRQFLKYRNILRWPFPKSLMKKTQLNLVSIPWHRATSWCGHSKTKKSRLVCFMGCRQGGHHFKKTLRSQAKTLVHNIMKVVRMTL